MQNSEGQSSLHEIQIMTINSHWLPILFEYLKFSNRKSLSLFTRYANRFGWTLDRISQLSTVIIMVKVNVIFRFGVVNFRITNVYIVVRGM